MTKLTPDEQLSDELAKFYDDPLGYVMFAFPWGESEDMQLVEMASEYQERFGCVYGPDVWACEFLDQLGEEIKKRKFNGRDAVPAIRFCTVSGHGIGKSAMTSWLIKFILDTRPMSVGTVTAMTVDQLKAKTWSELGKWHAMSLTSHWFDYTAGRGAMALISNRTDIQGESLGKTWKCTAQTCREENSEAFAGQHAPTATSFYIFDEASGIPDKIFEVREGGLTDGSPMIFDFGNGTRPSGRFFEQCEGANKDRYIVRSIDSRTVKITGKSQFEEWIEDYGVDSDFVKVRVRGMFPATGSAQFISREQVAEAMKREVTHDKSAALIIGVDVARFGDDESVIYPRIGYDARSFPPERYRGLDNVQLAGKVAEMIQFFRGLGQEVAMIFVDGGGTGSGVVDVLRHAGYPITEVLFGSAPVDNQVYRYKSDEMWGDMRKALPKLCLPAESGPDHGTAMDLKLQLTQREFAYTITGNKIHLEPKKDMKSRLGSVAASPDIADALACTFFMEVAPARTLDGSLRNKARVVTADYNPLKIDF